MSQSKNYFCGKNAPKVPNLEELNYYFSIYKEWVAICVPPPPPNFMIFFKW
jgi:hypothetical protein